MSETATPEREASSYPRVVRAVFETPWAILEGTLAAILDLIALRASGEQLSEEEIQARIGGGPARKDVFMAGTVAVLPIYGVIVPRADLFSAMSGGSSVQRLSQAFDSIVSDKDVSAIVLDVDSPGGQTDMIAEFAAEIRAARGAKPIVAVANTHASSAAYWLASQADEVVGTPSAQVGSIGVFAAHKSIAELEKKAGIETTLISAGKHKTEASPFAALSKEAKAAIQARVDDAYEMFVSDVAVGRGVPVDTVRTGYGEGRVLPARAALAEGMIDRISTLDETVARLSHGAGAPDTEPEEPPLPDLEEAASARSSISFADQAFALRDGAKALSTRLSSLAEVERGRLTAAKRDPLSACPDELRAAAQHIDEVLAATDPDKDQHAVLSVVAQYEARLAIARGGLER